MPLFVIQWKDRLPDGPAIRAATREAHLAWAGSQPLKIRLGGPFLTADDGMAGSLIVVEAPDLAAARALHADDPYTKAGLYERSTVDLWRVTLPWKD